MSPDDALRPSNTGRVDVTNLREEYLRPFTGTLRWVLLGAQMITLITGTAQILSGSWPARAVGAVLVACAVLGVLMQYWRPPATLIGAEGLRVRKVLFPGQLVRWAGLARIDVQGRFEEQSIAHTTDGRRIPLIGLTRQDAEYLVQAIS